MGTASAAAQEAVPVRVVTDAEVVERLRAGVAAAGSQRAYARSAGLNETDLSQALRGRQAPSRSQLRAVGVRWALVAGDDR